MLFTTFKEEIVGKKQCDISAVKRNYSIIRSIGTDSRHNGTSQHKFDKHCPKVKNQISNKDDVLRVGTRDILRQTFNVQQGERNVENARKKDISNNVAKQTKPEITTRGVVTQL
jgi:hypothetical protein